MAKARKKDPAVEMPNKELYIVKPHHKVVTIPTYRKEPVESRKKINARNRENGKSFEQYLQRYFTEWAIENGLMEEYERGKGKLRTPQSGASWVKGDLGVPYWNGTSFYIEAKTTRDLNVLGQAEMRIPLMWFPKMKRESLAMGRLFETLMIHWFKKPINIVLFPAEKNHLLRIPIEPDEVVKVVDLVERDRVKPKPGGYSTFTITYTDDIQDLALYKIPRREGKWNSTTDHYEYYRMTLTDFRSRL